MWISRFRDRAPPNPQHNGCVHLVTMVVQGCGRRRCEGRYMASEIFPPKKPAARATAEATMPVANLTKRVHTVPAYECSKCGHLTVNQKAGAKRRKCAKCQCRKLTEIMLIGRKVAA